MMTRDKIYMGYYDITQLKRILTAPFVIAAVSAKGSPAVLNDQYCPYILPLWTPDFPAEIFRFMIKKPPRESSAKKCTACRTPCLRR